jgi:hypothetical protein
MSFNANLPSGSVACGFGAGGLGVLADLWTQLAIRNPTKVHKQLPIAPQKPQNPILLDYSK